MLELVLRLSKLGLLSLGLVQDFSALFLDARAPMRRKSRPGGNRQPRYRRWGRGMGAGAGDIEARPKGVSKHACLAECTCPEAGDKSLPDSRRLRRVVGESSCPKCSFYGCSCEETALHRSTDAKMRHRVCLSSSVPITSTSIVCLLARGQARSPVAPRTNRKKTGSERSAHDQGPREGGRGVAQTERGGRGGG